MNSFNRSDILLDFELYVTWKEVDCKQFSTTVAFVEFLEDAISQGYPLLGVIGPSWPPNDERLSDLLGKEDISLLHINVAHSLNERMHPLSFNMLGAPRVLLDACLALIKKNSWVRANIAYESWHDGYLPLEIVQLKRMLDSLQLEHNITALDPTGPISLRPQHQLQLFFVGRKLSLIHKILCASLYMNLMHPTYQFIFVTSLLDVNMQTHLSSSIDVNGRTYLYF